MKIFYDKTMGKILFCVFAFTTTVFSATSVSTTVTAIVGESPTKNTNQTIIKYKESTKDSSEIIEWIQTNKNGIKHISANHPSFSETTIGTDSTSEYYYSKPKDKTEISVNVINNTANISATINSKIIESVVPLDNAPFVYPPGFYVSDFVKSDKRKLFIWVINKSEATLSQMIFTKIGKETININGKDVECIKTEMKPSGIGGMFWKAYYWHNAKTAEFIRYFGKKGPPGTPDYTIEKITE